ncbi:MAG: hypothetical protein JSW64_01950 [Candidatus Zixiibacteriota bacterium]|nr:MAG: hypothetical protein JSW64_01950 [candidate division Zixibacteria bacterium]
MRRNIIILMIILLAALAVNASALGLTKTKSIKHQMLEDGLAMERISSRELAFSGQDEEEILGDIYEYRMKSPFKAFVMSLAVPGLGEFYVGQKIKAGSFLAADVILWTGYFIYRGKGNDKEEEYKQYAHDHYLWNTYIDWWNSGGVSDSIKETYSHTMPWDSTANQPIFNHEYYENIGKYDQFQVGWDDIGTNFPPPPIPGGTSVISAHRAFYLNLRKQSNDYFSTASTVAMISIANHIISAFDAAIAAKKFNRGTRQYSFRFNAKRYDGEMTPFLEFTAKF